MTSLIGELIEHDIGTNGRLAIRGVEGSIDLTAVDGTTVRVEGTGSRPIEDDYRVRRTADGLELAAIEDRGPFGLGRAFHRDRADHGPRPARARVWIETASGPIRAGRAQRRPALPLGLGRASHRGRRRLDRPRDRVRRRPGRGGRRPPRRGPERVRRPRRPGADHRDPPAAHDQRRRSAWPGRSSRAGRIRHRDRVGRRHAAARRPGPGPGVDGVGRRREPARASLRRQAGTTDDRARRRRPLISFRSISGDIRVDAGAPAPVSGRRRPTSAPADAVPTAVRPQQAGDVSSPTMCGCGSCASSRRPRSMSPRRSAVSPTLEPIEPGAPHAGSGGAGDAGLGWVRRV